jgi:hypothetical protein
MPRSPLLLLSILLSISIARGQQRWINMDSLFTGLPGSLHIYRTDAKLSGRPFIAWYVEADISDRALQFDTDTTLGRRLTPSQFHAKNGAPAVVVNGTFFSFATNQNLNLVVKDGKLVSHNVTSIQGKGKDSTIFFKVSRSAIGISRDRHADVAWLLTDSGQRRPRAWQHMPVTRKDKTNGISIRDTLWKHARKWNMQAAIGGGPVLVHDAKVRITNDEERMFMGKAREDLHPRTAMGYTKDGKLIILAVEGRRPGVAEGASLTDLAKLFVELGAQEALNLDGGGSSCLLVMGKETIRPSDKEGQRPVPGVFIIK